VLLSPVAWIHHLAWVVLVLAVLLDDARDRRRIAAAVVTGVFYVLEVPWWGLDLMRDGAPDAVAVPLHNGFGLAAVVLVAVLPARRSIGRPAQRANVRDAPFAPSGAA